MLHIESASLLIPAMAAHHNSFADKPRRSDALRFPQYFHCESRGEIAGFQLEAEPEIRRYSEFLKSADTQGRGHVDPGDLAPYRGYMLATKVTAAGEPLAMHRHLVDAQGGPVVLYQWAALFAVEADSQRRNRIGRAHRWLHFQEMLKFKETGASIYDLGGYAKGTTHSKLKGINQFKDGFGGSLAEQSNYISHVALLWNRFRGGTGAI